MNPTNRNERRILTAFLNSHSHTLILHKACFSVTLQDFAPMTTSAAQGFMLVGIPILSMCFLISLLVCFIVGLAMNKQLGELTWKGKGGITGFILMVMMWLQIVTGMFMLFSPVYATGMVFMLLPFLGIWSIVNQEKNFALLHAVLVFYFIPNMTNDLAALAESSASPQGCSGIFGDNSGFCNDGWVTFLQLVLMSYIFYSYILAFSSFLAFTKDGVTPSFLEFLLGKAEITVGSDFVAIDDSNSNAANYTAPLAPSGASCSPSSPTTGARTQLRCLLAPPPRLSLSHTHTHTPSLPLFSPHAGTGDL